MIKSYPYLKIYKKLILIHLDNSKRVDLYLITRRKFVLNFVNAYCDIK